MWLNDNHPIDIIELLVLYHADGVLSRLFVK